jgi:hypothetical protein
VLSGITRDGRRDTRVRDTALDSLDRMVLLNHVWPHVSDPWLVIWDGSPMHQGQVRAFLAAGGAQPRPVAQLPSYAPDLHPAEGVWHPWKHVDMRHLCGRNLAHRRSELGRAMRRVRRTPHVMPACFAKVGLSLEN